MIKHVRGGVSSLHSMNIFNSRYTSTHNRHLLSVKISKVNTYFSFFADKKSFFLIITIMTITMMSLKCVSASKDVIGDLSFIIYMSYFNMSMLNIFLSVDPTTVI